MRVGQGVIDRTTSKVVLKGREGTHPDESGSECNRQFIQSYKLLTTTPSSITLYMSDHTPELA